MVTGDAIAALGDGDDVLLRAARLVGRAGSVRAPGERWEYDNGNYFVAGAALAEVTGTSYEDAVDRFVLTLWGMPRTSYEPPRDLVPGVDSGTPVAPTAYPRGRRPSGGLCSCVEDLLTFGEHLLADDALLAETARPRTRADDPMTYGLGWAVGPSGQMYLNGRLPGYRTALLLVPDVGLVGVALTADTDALPEAAAALGDLQRSLTGDDLSAAIDAFAA